MNIGSGEVRVRCMERVTWKLTLPKQIAKRNLLYGPAKVNRGSVSIQRVVMGREMGQSVQSLSHIRLFVTPWTAACQASLSITNSWNLLKLMSIESVTLSNHLMLCCLLLLLPSIFPSIRVFSNKSVLYIRWPKYWSFSFNVSPSKEYSGLISFRMDWLDLLAVQGTYKVGLSSI